MNKQEQWKIEALGAREEYSFMKDSILATNSFCAGFIAGRKKGDEEVEHLKSFPWVKANATLSMKQGDLEHEIAQLKSKLELSDNSFNGVLKVSLDRLRMIDQLKEQLKLERECIDFYASKQDAKAMKNDWTPTHGYGKRARSVQAQRKVEI